MLAHSAPREDPPLVGTDTTDASSIEVEAMGAPYTDGGSGEGCKVKLAPPRRTLCSPVAKPSLWSRSYCSS